MAIFPTITQQELESVGVVGLPDTPSMTARANMPDDARTAIMGHTSISMTNHYTHRDTASLAKLLGQAIPDLHDDMDVIDVQVIDEAA